jgi:hypothetical protein
MLDFVLLIWFGPIYFFQKNIDQFRCFHPYKNFVEKFTIPIKVKYLFNLKNILNRFRKIIVNLGQYLATYGENKMIDN